MEGIVNFGPNVVSFLLTSGSQIWYIVGAYVLPNYAPAIHRIEQALEATSKGMEVIMLGELSVRLREPQDAREDKLATALVDSGLVYTTYHFMPRRR